MKAQNQRLHGAFDPFADVPLPVEALPDPVSLER